MLVGNKIFTRRGEGFLFAFSVSCKAFFFLKRGSAGAAGAKNVTLIKTFAETSFRFQRGIIGRSMV